MLKGFFVVKFAAECILTEQTKKELLCRSMQPYLVSS